MPLLRHALLACLAAASLHARDLTLVRVWPGWKDADAFARIREHFGGPEGDGRRRVLRTNPAERSGYYFLVRLRGPAVPGAAFELAVLPPGATEPATHRFAATLAAGEQVFELGLTGAAWPGGAAARPVAWRLRILGPDGVVLAEQRSFLWEAPGGGP